MSSSEPSDSIDSSAGPPSAIRRDLWRDRGVLAIAAASLLLHLATARGYGYFRDELYYLACGEHPAWGYVDHPPMVGWLAAVVRATLGSSLVALRAVPALASAATALFAAAIAAELGGGRCARRLAALGSVLCPVYLSLFSLLSMNALDVLFWTVAWWLLARLVRTGDERLWLAFGAVCGIGLLNKISLLFLGAGVALGVVLVRRRSLRQRWIWLGGALAGLLFLPHLIWQQLHGWPTLEFMDNARRLKIAPLGLGSFALEQVLQIGALAAPLWLAGWIDLVRGKPERQGKLLGLAFLTVFLILAFTGAKAYYLGAAYALLLAAGGVSVERWSAGKGGRRALRGLATALVLIGGLLSAPLAKPLLPVEGFVRYSQALGIRAANAENSALGRLPQLFADMHGWPELAESVAGVYHALPAAERQRACIFGQNYGQAGAIDFFGPALGLPKAISTHNSYHLWGPRSCTGEVLIVIGEDREELSTFFEQVEEGAHYRCRDCMPYEGDKRIWVARQPRRDLREVWPEIRNFI